MSIRYENKQISCDKCGKLFDATELTELEFKHYCAKCLEEQAPKDYDALSEELITQILGPENQDCIIFTIKQLPRICVKYKYTKEEVYKVLYYILKHKEDTINETFEPRFGLDTLIFRYYKKGLEEWYQTHELQDLLREKIKEYKEQMNQYKPSKKQKIINGNYDFSKLVTNDIKEKQEAFKEQQADKLFGKKYDFSFLSSEDDTI